MRKLRRFSIIFFIFAVAVFCAYRTHINQNADPNGPEISMQQPRIEVSCDAEDKELLAGVTAWDVRDGDVTDKLVVESKDGFLERGRRNITIAVSDSENHVTKVTREVVYTDYEPPRFSLSEPLRFPMNSKSITDGLSATDKLDGDISGKIKISAESDLQIDTVGVYTVVFSVTNSAGDMVSVPMTVEIYSREEEAYNPEIILSEYLVYTPVGTAIEPWDYVDGISIGEYDYVRRKDVLSLKASQRNSQIEPTIKKQDFRISQWVDYNTPGVYDVVYRYTDTIYGKERYGTVRLVVVVYE